MIKSFRKFNENSSLLDIKGNVDSDLISKIQKILPNGGSILEISCGNGQDSLKLLEMGYEVKATEIDQNYVQNAKKLGIDCILHDTRNPLPFNRGEFDLVYSRLSLHYFTEEELVKIFSDIRRVSRSIIFTVKTQDDKLKTGKVIYPPKFWMDIVENFFNIISFDINSGKLYGEDSTWLEVAGSVK